MFFFLQPVYPFSDGFAGNACSNGLGGQVQNTGTDSLSPAAAAVAAVVRQQMQMASAGYHPDVAASFNMSSHCQNLNSSNNGSSAGCIPMPKLSSPATTGQLGNNGGNGMPTLPRLGSPSIPSLSNSVHSLSGIPGLHIMQGLRNHLSGGQSSQQPGITITPAHATSTSTGSNSSICRTSSSQSLANAMAQLASPSIVTSSSTTLNLNRLSSPTGSVHDLRITSPENVPAHSPLDNLESAGMNLAMSGLTYKTPRGGYTTSPRSDLFHDDLNEFVNAQRSCPSRLSGYKESTSNSIKLEPLTDCRGD